MIVGRTPFHDSTYNPGLVFTIHTKSYRLFESKPKPNHVILVYDATKKVNRRCQMQRKLLMNAITHTYRCYLNPIIFRL